MTSILTCVDLFAGAGGFSLAAKEEGFALRLAIENSLHAVNTYKANLCDSTEYPLVIDEDISTLDVRVTYERAFPGDDSCDLLLGGPPCQGFSTHRINNAGVSDKRNDLIHIYFDFVRQFKPAMFLMENVPGMLWPRHAAALAKFYHEGDNSGYQVMEPVVIDARDYGVHQRRKRVFILGIRKGVSTDGLSWPPKPSHQNPAARVSDQSLPAWVPCRSAFEPALPNDLNDVHMNHSEEVLQAFRNTPLNGGSRKDSGRILACHKTHSGHNDVYGRIDPASPAPTMTTACINPSKGRFVHPELHHGITARQAARLQTFPDSFVFSGGLMAAGQQIGNAVPVNLAKRLISTIKPFIAAANVQKLSLGKSSV